MTFKEQHNIDSGETEYVIDLGSLSVHSHKNLDGTNELILSDDDLTDLYFSLKEVVCQ